MSLNIPHHDSTAPLSEDELKALLHRQQLEKTVGGRRVLELEAESAYDSPAALFAEVRGFLTEHLDLDVETHYDILAAKIFETWLIERFNTVGYIYFSGPPRSGKTRALETIAELSRHAKLAATISAAVIPRYLNMEENRDISLFIDEFQQYLAGPDCGTMLAVINAGYRRGLKAIINLQSNSGWVPTELECFCSKFLAGTEETGKALASRCLIISMAKNIKRIPLKIDEERAAKIRAKLTRFAEDTKNIPIPEVESLFIELGIRDNRLIEITKNLVALSPPTPRAAILQYVKAEDDFINEEDGLSFYADIVKAVADAYKIYGKNGKIGLKQIADQYNRGREDEDQISGKSLGTHLNILGFNKTTRLNGGAAARYIEPRWLNRVLHRYVTQRTLNPISEESEESEATLSKDTPETTPILEEYPAGATHTLSSLSSDSSLIDQETKKRLILMAARNVLIEELGSVGKITFSIKMDKIHGFTEGDWFPVLTNDNDFRIDSNTVNFARPAYTGTPHADSIISETPP